MLDPVPGTHEVALVIDAYAAAWRSGDANGVLSFFAPDAVILPHDGLTPQVGTDALRAFWFPTARGASGVDEFHFDVRGVAERDETAIAWGLRRLRYWVEKGGERSTFLFNGTFLIVFGRRDGAWRITHFMWDDPPPESS